jgi:hypothetical protein
MSGTAPPFPPTQMPAPGTGAGPITGGVMPYGSVGPAVPLGVGSGLLRVISPDALTAQEQLETAERQRAKFEARMEPAMEDLAAYIRRKFDVMKNHRNGPSGWTNRLLAALRMFNGEYEPGKLDAIREYGGSEIYARLVAVKCRASSAMLKDIYLNAGDKPWDIEPTPVPTIPDDMTGAVEQLLQAEAGGAAYGAAQGVVDPETGQPITPPTEEEIATRKLVLESQAEQATIKKAHEEAAEARRHLNDMLVEGGFYKALGEFLTDLPLFPFACIRGPIVYMTNSISWERGAPGPDGKPGKAKLVKKPKARMYWKRVSPFDLWWTPGASTPEAADFVFRDRKARSELNAMLGVPGYREDQLRQVLEFYPQGYIESHDVADSTRADQESREDPQMNESGMYDVLEYHGSVQGALLMQWGMSKKDVPDEVVDYSVQLWMIGRYVIKVQMSPSPRERPPFYITSYDKVPGTMVGNAVPDMLSDIQDVANATLRALVNNMAMSSGPQVAVNDAIISASENVDRIWPWRIWRFAPRPGAHQADPIKFFQPASNVQQLLVAYERMTQVADEISAIPRYTTGSERMGGAGRTASGLAMLMGNASKMLQTVAANVDADMFEPMLEYLYDILMLTDESGRLRGDERIVVQGVKVAMQRETDRQRQIEMLQATANPVDMEILGLAGRGKLLRAATNNMGMDGQGVVPTDDELQKRQQMKQAAALAPPSVPIPGATPADANPNAAGQGQQRGGAETGPREIQGPRVNLQAQRPAQ